MREKQAEAHLESIEAVGYQQALRQQQTSPIRWDDKTEERMQAAIEDLKNPDWAGTSARALPWGFRDHSHAHARDGPSGAGKTSFGHELAAALRERGRPTLRASLDDFKRPWRHAREHGYDG